MISDIINLDSFCSLCLHSKVCAFKTHGSIIIDEAHKQLESLHIDENDNPITITPTCSSFLPLITTNCIPYDPNVCMKVDSNSENK